MEVVWEKINGFNNYSVSNFGEVRNDTTNKLLKGRLNKGGYYQVGLILNGIVTKKSVHRLVGEAFITNPENKECIDHIDGCRTNNNVTNLRWATLRENQWNTKLRSNNTSGVKGVSWYKPTKKWVAQIRLNKKIYLGLFDNIEDAKIAVEKAREKLHNIYANHG